LSLSSKINLTSPIKINAAPSSIINIAKGVALLKYDAEIVTSRTPNTNNMIVVRIFIDSSHPIEFH
jgi:hypothetical protein